MTSRASSPSRRPRWPAAVVVALAAAAGVLPGASRAAVPVGLYPLQAEGLSEGERSEVQAIVESALQGAAARGVLEPRTPLVVPANCKAPITVGCVATLAKGGVVLYAKAKRRGAQIQVTVLFVDAAGRRTRAAAFPVDLFIQNLRPANDAIATVEAELAAGALEDPTPPPPPPGARPQVAEPAAPPPARAERTERPAVTEVPLPPPPDLSAKPAEPPPPPRPPPVASAPIDLAPRPKAEPSRAPRIPEPPAPADARGRGWRRTAGAWSAGGGVAMIAAGAVVGLTAKRLSDALQDRFDRGVLRPDDRRLYERVDRYENVANVLFIAGGAFTLGGLTLQAMAPGGGAGVAMAGAF
ncbi:MAG TPA: hypothetical protein VLT61_02695 [Anaeromyxobacteraceae bacterium]|nr:hypothetical protein [Anaeromyxobacteraceae bacterium]